METITHDQLAEILRLHALWAKGLPGGVRADLRGADLHGVDLRGADLRDSDLHGADLRNADLRWADLSGSDLRYADLRGADRHRAKLAYANLRGADLGIIPVAPRAATEQDKPVCHECKGNPTYMYASGFSAPTPCSLCRPT